MLHDDELRAIESRCQAAMPGRWWVDFGENFQSLNTPKPVKGVVRNYNRKKVVEWNSKGDSGDYRDAEFIAHSREDVPKLIAEIKRLRGGA